MKVYPLYEFPDSGEQLMELLYRIDEAQPVDYEHCLELVHKVIGKRDSRTRITLNNLKKMGFFLGVKEVSLSWESQIYVDLGNRKIEELLMHLVYLQRELFSVCKLICQIDPELRLSNPGLLRELVEAGYKVGKIVSEKEKIYAIKKLIKMCQTAETTNPFADYEQYVAFVFTLQTNYLQLTQNQVGIPIEIQELEQLSGLSFTQFADYMNRLFLDPVYSSHASFTSVNKVFAEKKYYQLGNRNQFYYFNLLRLVMDRRDEDARG